MTNLDRIIIGGLLCYIAIGVHRGFKLMEENVEHLHQQLTTIESKG